MHIYPRPVLAAILSLAALPVAADESGDDPARSEEPVQSICDLSTPRPGLGCNARADLDGDSLLLLSDAPSCSLVQWALDGEPRTTLIVDEGARIGAIDPPTPSSRRELRRRIEIESCTRFVDTRGPEPRRRRGTNDQPLLETRTPFPSSWPSSNSGSPVRMPPDTYAIED